MSACNYSNAESPRNSGPAHAQQSVSFTPCAIQVNCGAGHDFRNSSCVADEHYIATLLAVYGQDDARSRAVQPLTFALFGDGDTHPHTFHPGETAAGIRAMKCRHWAGCAPKNPPPSPPLPWQCMA